MRALQWLIRGLGVAARAVVRAPVVAARWLVDHASRVLALLWLGGMAFVVVMTARRALRVMRAERDEPAVIAAAAPVNGDGPGEALQMMDVDEMAAITDDRMRALGLAAAGDSGDPDQAAIDAARARRGKPAALAGEAVGGTGGGKIVVVSKGGIAGWIQRNKGKKPDPETLAWLRGEEKAEGRAAYAGWADRGDGDLMSWLKTNRGSGGEAAALAPEGSAAAPAPAPGSAAAPAPAPAPASAPASTPAPASGGASAVDLVDLGTAAVRALSPATALAARRATLAELRAALTAGPQTRALVLQPHGRQLVLSLPAELLDDTGALTPAGTATIRKLGAIARGLRGHDLELRGPPDRALEVATQLVIGGCDPERLALVAAAGGDAAPLELVVLEAR